VVSAFASVRLDFGDALKGLDAMARAPLERAIAALKKPMRLDQVDHAKAKAGPESSWAPRAASTIASYRTHPKAPKKLMGKLPTAVSYKAAGLTLAGESRARWSDAHQTGATVGRGAKLPVRVFLWISDKLMAIAENELGDVVLEAFGGR
jgi:hypothetical protein